MAQKTILSDSPTKLIHRFHQELQKEHIYIDKIILFGSYATNTNKVYSDLDLCIVSSQFNPNNFDEIIKLKHISGKIDDMIEAHPYHPKDLQEKWDPLAEQIRLTGKTIIDNTQNPPL